MTRCGLYGELLLGILFGKRKRILRLHVFVYAIFGERNFWRCDFAVWGYPSASRAWPARVESIEKF